MKQKARKINLDNYNERFQHLLNNGYAMRPTEAMLRRNPLMTRFPMVSHWQAGSSVLVDLGSGDKLLCNTNRAETGMTPCVPRKYVLKMIFKLYLVTARGENPLVMANGQSKILQASENGDLLYDTVGNPVMGDKVCVMVLSSMFSFALNCLFHPVLCPLLISSALAQ